MSAGDPADPAAAVAAYLLSTSIATAVSSRIFRPELPKAQIDLMPRPCIVIMRSGGYQMFGGVNVPVGDPRLELFCYGSTWHEAELIADRVVPALRALHQSVWNHTRLYWARIAAGPMPFNDPEKNWPCYAVSAQVAHSDTTVA